MSSTLIREAPRPRQSRREPAPPSAPVDSRERSNRARRRRHLLWLAAGFPFAFAVPFLLADIARTRTGTSSTASTPLAVAGFVAGWARGAPASPGATSRATGAWGVVSRARRRRGDGGHRGRPHRGRDRPTRRARARRRRSCGAASLYGATDGVLLSVFPDPRRLRRVRRHAPPPVAGRNGRRRRRSRCWRRSAMTAVYHLGYADFRGENVRKPIDGGRGFGARRRSLHSARSARRSRTPACM